MRKKVYFYLGYCGVLLAFLVGIFSGNRAITVMIEGSPIRRNHTVVIDAGHGGIDGGATSCTGKLESAFNLEIAMRLKDLLHLLGYDTKMIRTSDRSVYTKGETIAQQKVSDLKERVKMVNETENALLLSIHQNHYTDSRYSGAQMFYSATDSRSESLAKNLQDSFKELIQPENDREIKLCGKELFLCYFSENPTVMVECGFLSNPEEAALLNTEEYQQKVAMTIFKGLTDYLNEQ